MNMAQQGKNDMLIRQAKAVLDFNWTGEYTMPGPRLYPHQWSWDSALIAIGYCHYDQDRAMGELLHLFESQWTNGLLPQIVFNPRFGEYFPGIEFWHAERSPDAPHAHKTSGVVQRPVHATAVLYVYQHAIRRSSGQRVPRTRLPQAEGLARVPSPGTRPRGRGFGLHTPPLGVGHGQLPDVGFNHGAHTATPRPDPAIPAC
jgi:hypothetical protein